RARRFSGPNRGRTPSRPFRKPLAEVEDDVDSRRVLRVLLPGENDETLAVGSHVVDIAPLERARAVDPEEGARLARREDGHGLQRHREELVPVDEEELPAVARPERRGAAAARNLPAA